MNEIPSGPVELDNNDSDKHKSNDDDEYPEESETEPEFDKTDNRDERNHDGRKSNIILPIEYPVLTIEELTKRLFDLERECSSMRKEIIALKSNRNEPAKNIVEEKFKFDDKKLLLHLKRRSIDADFALVKEYYLDDDPQPIRRKNLRTYEYYNRRWYQDTGTYIINTITKNLCKTYNALNTNKNFNFDETLLNQVHMEQIEHDPKYRRELLNKIIEVLFV